MYYDLAVKDYENSDLKTQVKELTGQLEILTAINKITSDNASTARLALEEQLLSAKHVQQRLNHRPSVSPKMNTDTTTNANPSENDILAKLAASLHNTPPENKRLGQENSQLLKSLQETRNSLLFKRI